VFNVASGEDRTIASIARDVVSLGNYRSEQITLVGERPAQVLRHTGDWSKISKVFGWKPQLTWNEGLKQTIAWYRQIAAHGRGNLLARNLDSGKLEYH
jgi:dTDP-glucose 4,6-dehydratase